MGRGRGTSSADSRGVLLSGRKKIRGEELGFDPKEAILPKRITKEILNDFDLDRAAKSLFDNQEIYRDPAARNRWQTDPVLTKILEHKWGKSKPELLEYQELFATDARQELFHSIESAKSLERVREYIDETPLNEIVYATSITRNYSAQLNDSFQEIGKTVSNEDIERIFDYALERGNFIDAGASAGELFQSWLKKATFDESKEKDVDDLFKYFGLTNYSAEHIRDSVVSPERTRKWVAGLDRQITDGKGVLPLIEEVQKKIYITETTRQLSDRIVSYPNELEPREYCERIVDFFIQPYEYGERGRFHQGIRDMNINHERKEMLKDLLSYGYSNKNHQGRFDKDRVRNLVETSLRHYFREPEKPKKPKFLFPGETRISNCCNYFFSVLDNAGVEYGSRTEHESYVIYNYAIKPIIN